MELKDPVTLTWSVSVNDHPFTRSSYQLQHQAPDQNGFIIPSSRGQNDFYNLRQHIHDAAVLLAQSPGSSYMPVIAYFEEYLDTVAPEITLAEIASYHAHPVIDEVRASSSPLDQSDGVDSVAEITRAITKDNESKGSGDHPGR